MYSNRFGEGKHSMMNEHVAATKARRALRRAPSALRLRGNDAYGTWTRLVLVGYVLITLIGINTSSLGVPLLLDKPDQPAPGLLANNPDPIRSDEFLRGTPMILGAIADPGLNFYPPESAREAPQGSLLHRVVRQSFHVEDTAAFAISPIGMAQAFALYWWFPVMLTLIAVPLWFRTLSVPAHIAIPIAVLAVICPATVWWSYGTLPSLAWAAASGVAAFFFVREAVMLPQRLTRGRAWLIVSSLLLVTTLSIVRLAWAYQRWSIPLAIMLITPLLVEAFRVSRTKRGTIVASVIAVVPAAIVLLWWVADPSSGYRVLAETVYPGSGRSTGASMSFGLLFGAPFQWRLSGGTNIVATNQSEIAAAFTFLGVAALALVPFVRWRFRGRPSGAVIAMALATLPFVAWCTIDWPAWSVHLTPLNLSDAKRIAQIIGLPAMLFFGLVLGAYTREDENDITPSRKWSAAAYAAFAVFVVTAIGGSTIHRENLPDLSFNVVLPTALLFAAVVAVGVRFSDRSWALVPLVLVCLPLTLGVMPVQHGLGDLHNGELASQVRRIAKKDPSARWASDWMPLDAITMASGIPSLSGQQVLGPNKAIWEKLAPRDTDHDVWNRGASYVFFTWVPAKKRESVSLANGDVIRIEMSPCSRRLRDLKLRYVLSTTKLEEGCLKQLGSAPYGGADHWIYAVS